MLKPGLPTKSVLEQPADGRARIGTMVLPQTWHTDLVIQLGFDFVWVDLEHASYTDEQCMAISTTARRAGIEVVTRLPRAMLWRIPNLLEFGASAIMVPSVESPLQAHEAVQYSRYPPRGTRGYSGIGLDAGYGLDNYSPGAETINLIMQIESQRGLANLDAIAGVEGVDALMIGRADFSVDASCESSLADPTMWDCVRRVALAASEHGIAWGSLIRAAGELDQLSSAGARFVAFGSPIRRIAAAYSALADSLGLPRGGSLESR